MCNYIKTTIKIISWGGITKEMPNKGFHLLLETGKSRGQLHLPGETIPEFSHHE